MANQFDNYYIEKDIHHNGKLVLAKASATWAERRSPISHTRNRCEGKPRPADIDGFTPEQQFFIAWGQFRGDEIRPEAQRLMVQSDPHPIAKYRVIGPLSNLPEFQRAWSLQSPRSHGPPRRKTLRCLGR